MFEEMKHDGTQPKTQEGSVMAVLQSPTELSADCTTENDGSSYGVKKSLHSLGDASTAVPPSQMTGELHLAAPTGEKTPAFLRLLEPVSRAVETTVAATRQEGTECGFGGQPVFVSVHIPHFSAWVVASVKPQLAAQPFVVHEEGVAVAVSTAARQLGLRCGMSLTRCKKRANGVLVIRRRPELEERSWAELLRLASHLSDRIETVTPGRFIMQLLPGQLPQLAVAVNQWSAQAGVAVDRATATLAAGLAETGEMLAVYAGHENRFLREVPLYHLVEHGVPSEAIHRLEEFGVLSVGQLRGYSSLLLAEIFGEEVGALLNLYSGGRLVAANTNVPDQWQVPQEISRAQKVSWTSPSLREVGEQLWPLVVEATRELGATSAGAVEVVLETNRGTFRSRQLLVRAVPGVVGGPADSVHLGRLKTAVDAALAASLWHQSRFGMHVSRVEVRLGALEACALEACAVEGPSAAKTDLPGQVKNPAVAPVVAFMVRLGRRALHLGRVTGADTAAGYCMAH